MACSFWTASGPKNTSAASLAVEGLGFALASSFFAFSIAFLMGSVRSGWSFSSSIRSMLSEGSRLMRFTAPAAPPVRSVMNAVGPITSKASASGSASGRIPEAFSTPASPPCCPISVPTSTPRVLRKSLTSSFAPLLATPASSRRKSLPRYLVPKNSPPASMAPEAIGAHPWPASRACRAPSKSPAASSFFACNSALSRVLCACAVPKSPAVDAEATLLESLAALVAAS